MSALRHGRLLGLLAVVLLETGCVIIPLPDHGHLDGRNEIAREQTEWLVPGETTIAEVLLAYGEPEKIEADGRVVVYAWTVSQGIIALGGGYAGEAAPIPRNYLLVLWFNAHGLLKGFEHTEARWFQTRAGRLEEWLEEHNLDDTPSM